MKTQFLTLCILILGFNSVYAFQGEGINKVENEKMVLTLIREKVAVKLVINSENLKRYETISVERSDVIDGPYRQIKMYLKDRIESTSDNSLVDYDMYPLALKNGAFYRVRTEEANGVMRVFPGVQLVGILQEAKIISDNFSETKNYNSAKAAAKSGSGMKDVSSSTRDVQELDNGLTTSNDEPKEDIFSSYDGKSASKTSISGNNIKKTQAKDSKDIIVSSGNSISIEESRDTYEPMYSKTNNLYKEYVLTGITDENRNSKAVKEFMKERTTNSKDIALEVLIENASISTEIILDNSEKYHQATIEYSDSEDGTYQPFKSFESNFINAKFFENKFTVIEPFFPPKDKKALFFRLKLIQEDGNQFVTKASNVAFP